MRRLPLSASLICAAFLVAPPAAAQVQSAASAANLRYTLGDLRPGDGQSAGVRFAPGDQNMTYDSIVYGAGASLLFTGQRNLSSEQGWVAEVDWQDFVHGSARLLPGTTFNVVGGSASAGIRPGPDHDNHTYAGLSSTQLYWLAPYSSLTVSVDVAVGVEIVPGAAWRQYGSAAASLLGYNADAPPGSGISYDFAFQMAYDEPSISKPEAHDARTLTITIDNPSDAWSEGQFYFELGATSNLSPLSPVPEPGGGAMLGAGLAVLGLAGSARRRKKRGAAAPLPTAQVQT